MMKIKSLFRRGQSVASGSKGPGSSVGLRGASSISSLDSKHKVAPISSHHVTKSKIGSRDKLDKINTQKSGPHHDKSKQHDKGNSINLSFKGIALA